MDVDAYDYDLPSAAIAQEPAEPRTAARLLDASAPDGTIRHRTVADLPEVVGPGDVVVVNDTRVIPARLRLTKETGGGVEVLLLEPADGDWWRALVRPSRRVAPGSVLLAGGEPAVEVGERLPDGIRLVRGTAPLAEVARRHGELALPPYIQQALADPDRYQTVYATHPGSVAAPTAGLHLTPGLLAAIETRGAAVHSVDLTVGLDTFKPIAVDRLDDHAMHSERYAVPAETIDACRKAERVIAIGTTTVRALEAAAAGALSGRTSLFIRPGYEFEVVDVLLTNFHMPRSSLLVMLAAFAGDRWRDLYREALAEGYRFLSFGDAMVVSRQP